MIDTEIIASIETLAALAQKKNRLLATAESCTGGLIAAAFTEISGSSVWFDRGFVTYSNSAKQQMLGVTADDLVTHGAVSEEVVIAMARGAVARSDADVAVSVSGVAGPSGGSEAKPVGTVWIACADRLSLTGGPDSDQTAPIKATACHYLFAGDRQSVRQQTVQHAVKLLIKCIETDAV